MTIISIAQEFFFVIVDVRVILRASIKTTTKFDICDSQVLDIQVFPIKTKFKILWELSNSDFPIPLTNAQDVVSLVVFCFIPSFVISFCEYLLLVL